MNVVTTKVPPGFDGRTLWLAYEEAIDEWCDITELDPAKRGPDLRSRLEGEDAIYKQMLDRDQLLSPENGVAYFKRALRPYFVKGAKNVFLHRLFAIFKSRGQQDLLRWMGMCQVMIPKLLEAWMDMHDDPQREDLRIQYVAVAGPF